MTYEIIQKDGQVYASGRFTADNGMEVYFEHPVGGEGDAEAEVQNMIGRYNVRMAFIQP